MSFLPNCMANYQPTFILPPMANQPSLQISILHHSSVVLQGTANCLSPMNTKGEVIAMDLF